MWWRTRHGRGPPARHHLLEQLPGPTEHPCRVPLAAAHTPGTAPFSRPGLNTQTVAGRSLQTIRGAPKPQVTQGAGLTPEEPHPYHLCTIGPARIDPLQQLGIVPDHALPYWWGGVRFLTSTGASSTGTMARCARSLVAGLDEIAREGDRPGGCSPRPWRPRSRRTLRRIYSTGTRTGVSHQGRSEHPFRTSSMLRATVIASVRSWHGRKANQPPRAVQTRDRVTGPV